MQNKTKKQIFSEVRQSYIKVNLHTLYFRERFCSEKDITVLSLLIQLLFFYNFL